MSKKREPVVLTEDQLYCKKVLAELYGGDHHLDPVKPCGDGISMRARRGEISTFDFDLMTAMVVAAHQYCVRIGVGPASPRELEITLHRRQPTGGMSGRHPSLADLSARVNAAASQNSPVPSLVKEMIQAGARSLEQLRSEISNVCYAEPGTIRFDFRGKTYRAAEPRDVMPIAAEKDSVASRSWALKRLLDGEAVPVVTPDAG